MKRCSQCHEEKPLSEFHRDASKPSGRRYRCRTCTAAAHHASRQRRSAKIKRYRIENRARERAQKRERTYGVSPEDYEARVAAQGGACAICGKRPTLLHIDHDHVTGNVRGLLCRKCNTGLGGFHDSTHLLARASEYLRRFHGDPLERLIDVTAAHEAAIEEKRAALLEAYAAGHTYAECAKVLGVSRQAVRQLLTR